MDLLKNILRPGGSTDDHILYGAPAPKRSPTQSISGSQGDAAPAGPGAVPGVNKQDSGVQRQPINSDGQTVGRQGYGTTASGAGLAAGGAAAQPAATNSSKGESFPVLYPGGDKHGARQYGESGRTNPGTAPSPLKLEEDALSSMSIKSGAKGPYAGKANRALAGSGPSRNAGSGATAGGSSLPNQSAPTTTSDRSHVGRDTAVAGGAGAAAAGVGATAYGSSKHNANSSQTPSKGSDVPVSSTSNDRSYPVRSSAPSSNAAYAPSSTKPASTTPASGTSTAPSSVDFAQRRGPSKAAAPDPSSGTQPHPSHKAAYTVAGAGALAAGGLGYESSKKRDPDVDRATSTERSYPLGRGASSTTAPSRNYAEPTRTTGVAGAGVPKTGGPGPADGRTAQGANVRADGSTLADYRRDSAVPHLPGEFPSEDGEDPHRSHRGRNVGIGGATGLGAAGLGTADYEASKDRNQSSTSTAQPSGYGTAYPASQGYPTSTAAQTAKPAPHHYGRDAAAAVGAGAAGVGAYKLASDRDATSQQKPTKTTTTSTSAAAPSSTTTTQAGSQPSSHYGRDAAAAGGTGAAGVGAYETTKRRDGPVPVSQAAGRADPTASSPKDTHYGRDAALAGGAGAAGVGTYEATKHRSNTGPASKTRGPHESNIANIVDPRVQPELSKTRTSKTNGSNGSDLANEPSSATAPEKGDEKPHYGRDAAVAGGVGAAGVGVYEGSKGHKETANETGGDEHIKGGNLSRSFKEEFGLGSQHKGSQIPTGESAVRESEENGHHYGRDAAIVGGTGAAGVGAYEAASNRTGDGPTQQQTTSAPDSRRGQQNKLHKKNDPRYMDDKHEYSLQKAREHEAAIGGDRGEEKEGLLHKILHPGTKDSPESSGATASGTGAAQGVPSSQGAPYAT